jgi:hypothetical protein
MYSSTLPLTSVVDGGGSLTPHPGRFTPGNGPVSVLQDAGWAQGPGPGVDIATTGIRSSDCPARSQLQQRLRYSGPPLHKM